MNLGNNLHFNDDNYVGYQSLIMRSNKTSFKVRLESYSSSNYTWNHSVENLVIEEIDYIIRKLSY